MRLLTLLRLVRFQIGIIICLCWFADAHAHEPFDITSRVTIYADRIELSCTLGPDGVWELLAGSGRSEKEIADTVRSLGPDNRVQHSISLAARLFEFKNNGTALVAKSVTSLSEGMEIIFDITYPRPAGGVLEIRAKCYETISSLKNGPLIISDDMTGSLGAGLLSSSNTLLSVTLPTVETKTLETASGETLPPTPKVEDAAPRRDDRPTARLTPPFRAFFVLGVEHILSGIDHLLFLAALLLGIRRFEGVVGVITYFTLAHSVTLALAALELVTVSSRVVEPLIALSIIAVCCDNLVRREHEKDRWWLAGAFGLFHGFGFAGALRETGLAHGGAELAVPLLSFNLGVEAGQLAAAAVVLPVLFLARRWQSWPRYGSPAVSCGVIVISGYWLVQRLFFV